MLADLNVDPDLDDYPVGRRATSGSLPRAFLPGHRTFLLADVLIVFGLVVVHAAGLLPAR